MHNSTILHATNCNGLSDVYSTRSTPWIGEKGRSKNLLDLMKIEMQCCLNATARNRWLLCFMLMDDEAISTPGCTS